MGQYTVVQNSRIELFLQLGGGHTDKYCRAYIYDINDNPILGGFINLEHKSFGYYSTSTPTYFPPGIDFLRATYVTYDDPLYSSVSAGYSIVSDTWSLVEVSEVYLTNSNKELVGELEPTTIVGIVQNEPTLTGTLDEDQLQGVLSKVDDELVGIIEPDNELVSNLE